MSVPWKLHTSVKVTGYARGGKIWNLGKVYNIFFLQGEKYDIVSPHAHIQQAFHAAWSEEENIDTWEKNVIFFTLVEFFYYSYPSRLRKMWARGKQYDAFSSQKMSVKVEKTGWPGLVRNLRCKKP